MLRLVVRPLVKLDSLILRQGDCGYWDREDLRWSATSRPNDSPPIGTAHRGMYGRSARRIAGVTLPKFWMCPSGKGKSGVARLIVIVIHGDGFLEYRGIAGARVDRDAGAVEMAHVVASNLVRRIGQAAGMIVIARAQQYCGRIDGASRQHVHARAVAPRAIRAFRFQRSMSPVGSGRSGGEPRYGSAAAHWHAGAREPHRRLRHPPWHASGREIRHRCCSVCTRPVPGVHRRAARPAAAQTDADPLARKASTNALNARLVLHWRVGVGRSAAVRWDPRPPRHARNTKTPPAHSEAPVHRSRWAMRVLYRRCGCAAQNPRACAARLQRRKIWYCRRRDSRSPA